ncbi:glutathione S-transferase C-terminal domain-containing protein [Streptosporangium saharense]|uniref:Glutathione S-transferase/putative glutathione S-transferase n=1 Tax=Streptosporangium saharense TaxID=1706840 RepID=A0A7W7QIP9_9ACTN|nr:glutathione S-transferase C-terminal domain-containing protein [Streptosporangium saharense]MBB4914300.1 glutathione S-transferase/putative glutathione S-transferase [Streptosporangium saharense]
MTASISTAPEPLKGRVTADGSSGFPAEPGRYHLYLAWSCPWAQRTAIVRGLKGLRETVTLSYVEDDLGAEGWTFGTGRGPDPVNGFTHLRQAYEATVPGYTGSVSVPALWDRATGGLVSNDYADITVDLGTQFEEWGDPEVRLYPPELRAEIDELNAYLHANLNGAAWEVAMTTTQEEYETARSRVIAALDLMEARLATHRFLFGDTITESDVWLWPTLARFDLLDNPLGKISERSLGDFPNLWGYARDLYQRPAFRDTTDFATFRRDRSSIRRPGPVRIEVEPVEADWELPHGRESVL